VNAVDWDFGDGTKATATTPGRAYDPADPCRTARCPGYWGHVYTVTGAMHLSAQVTWSGQFRVAGGAWEDIAGTVTGPRQTTTLTVKQARGVLVPDD
jgi:hypothetical protein